MKKKLSLTLLALVVTLTCSLGLAACGGGDGSAKLGFRLKDDDTYAVESVPLSATKITIPAEYEGKPVTSIDTGAFGEHTKIKSLVIPDSVTRIETQAFYGCTALKEVTIPDSVTYVESGVFAYTAWYDNQPDGIIYVGKAVYHFKGNVSADTVLAEGTTYIASAAFYGCTSLETISIPDSVTTIESQTFHSCTALKSITIPASVTSIGTSAFSGCSSLTDVAIPASVKSLGDSAFSGCSSLTNIVFNGTKSKWNSLLTKDNRYWDHQTGAYTVTCTDGEITKATK